MKDDKDLYWFVRSARREGLTLEDAIKELRQYWAADLQDELWQVQKGAAREG